ncbi:zinc finger, C2H2 type [Cooperia oncophora]
MSSIQAYSLYQNEGSTVKTDFSDSSKSTKIAVTTRTEYGEPSTSVDIPLSWVRREMSDSLKGFDSFVCGLNVDTSWTSKDAVSSLHFDAATFTRMANSRAGVICGFPPTLDIAYTGDITYCLWDNCHDNFSDPLHLFNHVMTHIDFSSVAERSWFVMQESMSLPTTSCLLGKLLRKSTFDITVERSIVRVLFAVASSQDLINSMNIFANGRRSHRAIRKNQHLCLLCQRRFGDERSLVNHVRRHINGRQCPTCGLAVQLPSDLHGTYGAIYLVKHTERIKTLTCPECDKSFYCATDLIRHSAVHGPPKEVCKVCGEHFRWKKQLDRHMTSHSATAMKQPYLCHICDCTYATGHGLTRHLSRKHECPIPEGFSRFSYKKCADGYYRLQTRKLVRTVLYEK